MFLCCFAKTIEMEININFKHVWENTHCCKCRGFLLTADHLLTCKLLLLTLQLALTVSAFLFTVTLASCTSCTSILTYLSFSLQKSWLLAGLQKRRQWLWKIQKGIYAFDYWESSLESSIVVWDQGQDFHPMSSLRPEIMGSSHWEPTAFFVDFPLLAPSGALIAIPTY